MGLGLLAEGRGGGFAAAHAPAVTEPPGVLM